jgi:hypothetical protein
MFLVRDIMHCKPGKVRPMVEKFLKLSHMNVQVGFGPMRIMTDFSGQRYWTVVSEMEIPSLEAFAEMSRKAMEMPEFKDVMKDYHDFVSEGRREIYVIEK